MLSPQEALVTPLLSQPGFLPSAAASRLQLLVCPSRHSLPVTALVAVSSHCFCPSPPNVTACPLTSLRVSLCLRPPLHGHRVCPKLPALPQQFWEQ